MENLQKQMCRNLQACGKPSIAADVNGDGFPDILAGNWGHNSKLWAGKNGPLKLYIKDFDRNGTVEQIMCYTVEWTGIYFPGKR